MDRIAIISDIHGNLEALKSVFSDIESRGITKIYCLGDIVSKGANSSECLKLVRDKCDVIVKGNWENFLSRDFTSDMLSDSAYRRYLWNKSNLSLDELAYCSSLPYCYEFYMSGSLVRLFHASPNHIYDFVFNLDSLENKYSLFVPTSNTISNKKADVVIYGHVHFQFLENLYNRTIVNVGSVGNPIDVIRNDFLDGDVSETTRANYLIIEGNLDSRVYDNSISFQFVKVPYDIEKELGSLDVMEKQEYSFELKEGRYRDMDRLRNSLSERNIDIESL